MDSDALLPRTHYGVFKQANEGNARVFAATDGIASIGLRPWAVYGVGRDAGLTSDPTFAAKAVALGQPYQIRISGTMDMQYVEDVAATFIACMRSDLQGAHAFNLSGDVVDMETIIAILEELRPGAAGLISASGARIPVAARLDATGLRQLVPGIPKTSLREGLRRTVELFETLHRQGRLSA
jgi:nucleoside-diphosphate-sugar epimerase